MSQCYDIITLIVHTYFAIYDKTSIASDKYVTHDNHHMWYKDQLGHNMNWDGSKVIELF